MSKPNVLGELSDINHNSALCQPLCNRLTPFNRLRAIAAGRGDSAPGRRPLRDVQQVKVLALRAPLHCCAAAVLSLHLPVCVNLGAQGLQGRDAGERPTLLRIQSGIEYG